jgi:hypothetical protein
MGQHDPASGFLYQGALFVFQLLVEARLDATHARE